MKNMKKVVLFTISALLLSFLSVGHANDRLNDWNITMPNQTVTKATAVALARIQGNAEAQNYYATGSLSVTLTKVPISGDTLICTVGIARVYSSTSIMLIVVSNITESNVAWDSVVTSSEVEGINGYDTEIWIGIVNASASTSITVNFNGTSPVQAAMDVCEYSGIRASGYTDKTSTNSGGLNLNSQTDTGTTSTTGGRVELWIGSTFASCIVPTLSNTQMQYSPLNNFTLLDGTMILGSNGLGQSSEAYLEKLVSNTGQANTGTKYAVNYIYWVGCIAAFFALPNAYLPQSYWLPFPSYSTTAYNSLCVFSCEWINGSNPIGTVLFSTNASGTWSWNNSLSPTAIDSTHFWTNWTATLPKWGSTAWYFWLCNDTGNNWVITNNQTVTSIGYTNVTTLGTTTSTSYGAGGNVAAQLFDDCIVFWRNLANGSFSLTAFNLSSGTFFDVWTSVGKSLPYGTGENGATNSSAGTVAAIPNGTLYFSYGWCTGIAGKNMYISTLMSTTDLSTVATVGNVSMALESICNYTGTGPNANKIMFGGYQSGGEGTYATIDNTTTSNPQSHNNLWHGTVYGSDDVCFLVMYNSTCMIGSDCAPNNIIYTNDGVNFVDEWNNPNYTSQYPFVWAWGVYVSNGTAYVAASGSIFGQAYYGGIATWKGAGSYAPTLYDTTVHLNLYTASYTVMGGSDNVLNTTTWTGSPIIITYNSTGGLVDEVWKNESAIGAVLSLVANPNINNSWYGLYYDAVSKNVTLIEITISTPVTVPEFQDTLILLLFMLSLIAVAASEKRFSRITRRLTRKAT